VLKYPRYATNNSVSLNLFFSAELLHFSSFFFNLERKRRKMIQEVYVRIHMLCVRVRACITQCSKTLSHISHELCNNPHERSHGNSLRNLKCKCYYRRNVGKSPHTFHSHWAISYTSWIIPKIQAALFSGLNCASDFPELHEQAYLQIINLWNEINHPNKPKINYSQKNLLRIRDSRPVKKIYRWK